MNSVHSRRMISIISSIRAPRCSQAAPTASRRRTRQNRSGGLQRRYKPPNLAPPDSEAVRRLVRVEGFPASDRDVPHETIEGRLSSSTEQKRAGS